jgi:tripartite-type tricarboxylate transporter receptor subunit TctC
VSPTEITEYTGVNPNRTQPHIEIWQRSLVAAFSVAVLLALDTVAAADSYPVRPIRIVVASAPGSGLGPDIVTRLIGHKLGETWQQQIIADNRTGAGGNVGADIVAHASPDGYTLLMATASQPISAALYPKLNCDLQRDFVPVIPARWNKACAMQWSCRRSANIPQNAFCNHC